MYDWAVRTLFEGNSARFVPWRARIRLERAALAACRLREGPDTIELRPRPTSSPAVTIAAVGDIALRSFAGKPERRARAISAIQGALDGADMRVGNLETVLTGRTERAGRLGSFLRAAPESVEVLARGGVDMVTCANNHCLDFGAAALAESVELVRSSGIDVCGVGATVAEARQPVIRTVNGLRIGMLGYCDDWRPGAARGYVPAGTLDAHILADIAALRPRVDVLVLQLHWGWEWAVHPLLGHRDRARRFAEAGADMVLCHHAHVPMAVEPWGRSIVAHGLGNFFFPWGGKTQHVPEHLWRDQSFALHVELSAAGVHRARIIPVTYDDGRVARSVGWERREMLGGLAALRQGLEDERRLAAIERDRMARAGRDVALRLQSLADRQDCARLEEAVAFLHVPRGATLMDGLDSLPDGSGSELASLLRSAAEEGVAPVARAARDGKVRAAADRLARSEYMNHEQPGRTP